MWAFVGCHRQGVCCMGGICKLSFDIWGGGGGVSGVSWNNCV